MAPADDKRGLELAELARQFLLWIRDNELPRLPGLRGAEPGHFEIHGDSDIMGPMDELLASFVAQSRMKLPGKTYVPCYRVIQ